MADLNDNDFILISPPAGFINCGIKKGQIIPPQANEPLYAHKFLNLYDVSALFPLMAGLNRTHTASLTNAAKELLAYDLKSFISSAAYNVSAYEDYGMDDVFYFTNLYSNPTSQPYVINTIDSSYASNTKYILSYIEQLTKRTYFPIPTPNISSNDPLSASPFSMASGSSSPFYCLYHDADNIKNSVAFPSDDKSLSTSDITTWSGNAQSCTGKYHRYYYSYSGGAYVLNEEESHPLEITLSNKILMNNGTSTSGQRTFKTIDIIDIKIVVYADVNAILYDDSKQRKIAFAVYDPSDIGSISSDTNYIYFSTSGTPFATACNDVTAITGLDITPPPSSSAIANVLETYCGFFPMISLKPEIASLINQL